jgi:hypothetical protein
MFGHLSTFGAGISCDSALNVGRGDARTRRTKLSNNDSDWQRAVADRERDHGRDPEL